MPDGKPDFRRSPLTDPRALAISLAFNGALMVGASLMALGVVLPSREQPEPRVLRGDIETTDNRVQAGSSGGSDGELGGEGVELSAERRTPVAPTRDPAADAILSEVLPTRPNAEASRTLPGPSTSGLGLIRGLGAGGGGGAGGGSGGGEGRGLGPGTEFFGLRDRAGSYAYVIDCSGSMDLRLGPARQYNVLDVVKRELLASLNQLPSDAKVGVIFYNQNPTVFTDPAGRKELMSASESNKARVREKLAEVLPTGGTDHISALRAALAMHPEVIFFLTDADFLDPAYAESIRREAGKVRILAVEFGVGASIRGSEPLRQLARATGGAYKYINVWSLGGGR